MYQFEFTQDEINIILQGLGELQLKISGAVASKIINEINKKNVGDKDERN